MTSALDKLTLDVTQSIDIAASIEQVYQDLVHRLSDENATPDNQPMPMVLETWPGGHWFRDLGGQQGHLWGFVQVIKPPRLIEIQGPLFMSYPVTSHVQFRLTEGDGVTQLTLRHQALGVIDDDHREGVQHGWSGPINCCASKKRLNSVPLGAIRNIKEYRSGRTGGFAGQW